MYCTIVFDHETDQVCNFWWTDTLAAASAAEARFAAKYHFDADGYERYSIETEQHSGLRYRD